jgi:hypothetical protein
MSDVGKNIRSPIIFRRVQFTLDIYRQHTPTLRNAACPSRIGHVPENRRNNIGTPPAQRHGRVLRTCPLDMFRILLERWTDFTGKTDWK